MKKINLIVALIIAILLLPAHIYAWDGYDFDSEDYIEFPDRESVIPGKDIEIYDHSDESYHEVYIISVRRDGTVIIEVFDNDSGDYRTFEMDDEIKAPETTFLNLFMKGDRYAFEHR